MMGETNVVSVSHGVLAREGKNCEIGDLRANVHEPKSETKTSYTAGASDQISVSSKLRTKKNCRRLGWEVYAVPSVLIDKSWKRKNTPGLRCSSSKRQAFADNGPTSVRV